jgi:putative acetyltransferase
MISKANSSDINYIMEIWKDSTIKAHNFIEREYWETNYDVVKDVYLPIAETFVYEANNKIIGFISIINNDFIGALFVDSNMQGKGIGSKLIDFVKDRYDKLSLAVYKDNINAVNFYKNKRFKIVKEQINEDSGFAEYIMNYN